MKHHAHPHPESQEPANTGIFLEEETQEPTFLYPLGIPVVALFALLVLNPAALVWALPVALIAGVVAYLATRDIPITIAALGIAPLLVTTGTGPITLALVGLVALAWATRTSLVLVAAGLGVLLSDPLGGILLAFAITLLVCWPHKESQGPTTWYGLPPNHFKDRAALISAFALAVIGAVFTNPFWVPALGLVGGLVARLLARHPANARIGAAVVRIGVVLAAVPAAFILLLATLERLPPVSELRTLIMAWGLVAIGLLVLLYAFGTELLLRSRGPGSAIALGALSTSLVLAIIMTFLVRFDVGVFVVGPGWALLSPWVAVGAARVTRVLPKQAVWAWLVVTLLVAMAYGIHVL